MAPATSGAQSPATPSAVATPIPGVPSPGAPGIGDPYYPLLGNGGYDAIHYTIALELDIEAGAIVDATTTIDALATQDLSAFNLDFRGPQIDAVTVDGAPADWTRDGGELTISPAQPLPAGEPFQTEVRYHGTPADRRRRPVRARLVDDRSLDLYGRRAGGI